MRHGGQQPRRCAQRRVRGCSSSDSLRNGDKFRNVADLRIADYLDRGAFMERLATGRLPKIDAIFHQGACTDTTERDGQLMMERNYRASRDVLISRSGSACR